MALASRNKVDPNFNMSSMTDLIFLLLIFFMLTSNFATPSGLPIKLPTAKTSSKALPRVNVSITKDIRYYVNEVEIPLNAMEAELAYQLSKETQGTLILSVDKDVPVKYMAEVAAIATKLRAKVSIATLPEE